jgi:F0F1-type ATP synthase membrane subunit b/b'
MTDIISEELVVAICFVVFVFFAYRPIKKAVSNALEQKISEIKDNLQKAETLKEEAKSTLELLQKS